MSLNDVSNTLEAASPSVDYQLGRDLHFRCSTQTLRLAQLDLARSGLNLDQVTCEGIFAVDDASTINPAFAKAPALILPYSDASAQALVYAAGDKRLPFCRARYLVPTGRKLPRDRKYDQPGESGTPPFFSRSFDWSQFDNGEINGVCLVEGEKKSIALCRAGVPAIGIAGVFNYADGSVPLHPAIARIAAKCSDVWILFDSDAAENSHIQLAEWRLAGQLALTGTRAHVVRIPPGGDAKVGADDFLVKQGAQALMELIMNTPALGEAPSREVAHDEISVADILNREVAAVEELIPGWLEKGVPNFLAGPGGVHKSRLAMQWGLTINAGAAVWGIGAEVSGLHTGAKASLVFCAAEDDANELARRAQAIASALRLKRPDQGVFVARKGEDSALVIMHENANTEVRPFYHRLVERLRSIDGHKVVVLDSAYDFVRFAGRAKIDEDAVNYFIKVVLQRLCDLTDSTLIIPWHPSQAGSSRDTMDGWSVAWHNAPRARLALSAVDGMEDTYELKVVKRNHGRKGEPIRLKFHEGALLPLDAVPDDGKAAATYRACIAAAVDAARMGAPFTRQRNISPGIVAEISKRAGVQVSAKRVKEELDTAVYRRDRINYVSGHGRTKAGYYPVTEDANRATHLANSDSSAC